MPDLELMATDLVAVAETMQESKPTAAALLAAAAYLVGTALEVLADA